MNYHAVPGNYRRVSWLRLQTVRLWLRSLRRRSQKHRLNWDRFAAIADGWIPSARILHEYPNVRFFAKHPR